MKDLNQYIALLVEMEKYFFALLETRFRLSLNEKYSKTDDISKEISKEFYALNQYIYETLHNP